MITKKIETKRKTYFRRGVLHLCAGKMLLRAPENTLAQKGDEVTLLEVELDDDGIAVSGSVEATGGTLETWVPWPEGRSKTEGGGGGRKLYERRKTVHFCHNGMLFQRPSGSEATTEDRVDVIESTEDAAIVRLSGHESVTEEWARWPEGEKKEKKEKKD